MRTREEKKLHCKGNHSSSVSTLGALNRLVRLQTWKKAVVHCSVENAAVLHENHHERVTQI